LRTDTKLAITVPAAMAEQLKHVQKKENRSRSELMREAWRHYFESHYAGYTPSDAEIAAIRKGRAEISRGQYKTLQELRSDLDNSHREASRKADRKGSR
jgi:predicted transcriptional regulator